MGGYRFPDDLKGEVTKKTKLEFLGKIAYDKDVENLVLSGRSLLELPNTSPAYVSVKKVVAKAGY